MNRLTKIILIASCVVLVYDTCGALASKMLGFPYASLMLGSCLIYAGAGFFAGQEKGLAVGTLAGAVAGLVDATLGWAISWNLDVGRPPEEVMHLVTVFVAVTVVMVTLLGAGLGFVGAALSTGRPEKTS